MCLKKIGAVHAVYWLVKAESGTGNQGFSTAAEEDRTFGAK